MLTTEKQLQRFWSKVNKRPDGVWEWTAYKNKAGYGWFCVKHGRSALAHRISWELANGPIPEGMCVLHKNDIPYDVNPDNLFLGTHSENIADMVRKNRQAGGTQPGTNKGTANGQAKINELKAQAIRDLYKTGNYTQLELGALFGLSQQAIHKIVTGKLWTP